MAELRASELEFIRRLGVALPEGAKDKEVIEYVMNLTVNDFSEYVTSLCGTTAEIKYLVRERGRLIAAASAPTSSSSASSSALPAMIKSSSSMTSPPQVPESSSSSSSFKSTTNSTNRNVPVSKEKRSFDKSNRPASSTNMSSSASGKSGDFRSSTTKDSTTKDVSTPNLGKALPDRETRGQFCPCMATKHRCLGNCIHCGKIICEAEADRFCSFCDAELPFAANLTTDQLLKLRTRIFESNVAAAHEVAAAASSSSAVTFKKGLKADSPSFVPSFFSSTTTCCDDSGKGDKVASSSSSSSSAFVIKTADERILNSNGMAKAIAHKNKLLEFQTNSAARTTVRDDDSEWFALGSTVNESNASAGAGGLSAKAQPAAATASGDSNSVWLTPEERKRAAEVESARIAAVSNRRRVTRLQINYVGGIADVIADTILSNSKE